MRLATSWAVVAICVLVLSFAGCAGKDSMLNPKDPVQGGIAKMLAGMEKAWAAQNAKAYLGYFGEALIYKQGPNQSAQLFSKSEYAAVLPSMMAKSGELMLNGAEMVELNGFTARIKLVVEMGGVKTPQIWNLEVFNGQWKVMSNEY